MDGLNDVKILRKLTDKVPGLKPAYPVLGLSVLTLLFLALGLFENCLSNLVATVYPLIISLKTIQGNNDKESKKWLTYWILFCLIDSFDPIF